MPFLNYESAENMQAITHTRCQCCKDYFPKDSLIENVWTGEMLCDECNHRTNFENESPLNIKVEASSSGWGYPWYAYDGNQGLDYDWTGDSWQSCGSPIGEGRTIQEAIEALLENDRYPIGISYTWN